VGARHERCSKRDLQKEGREMMVVASWHQLGCGYEEEKGGAILAPVIVLSGPEFFQQVVTVT